MRTVTHFEEGDLVKIISSYGGWAVGEIAEVVSVKINPNSIDDITLKSIQEKFPERTHFTIGAQRVTLYVDNKQLKVVNEKVKAYRKQLMDELTQKGTDK